MKWISPFAYGVGHVLNDITGCVWFTYTLLYFQAGLKMTASLGGVVMLFGQAVDALATPLVGIYADRSQLLAQIKSNNNFWFTVWFPKGRFAWHFYGSIIVLLSFPFIFSPTYGDENADSWAKLIYYIPIIAIFQIGWSAVQISHLALMNELTEDSNERIFLTTLRYFFTVFSNLIVFIVAFFLLRHQPKREDIFFNKVFNYTFYSEMKYATTSQNLLDDSKFSDFYKKDFLVFRSLVYILVFIGFIFTLVFHLYFGFENKNYQITYKNDCTSLSQSDTRILISVNSFDKPLIKNQMEWFKVPQFWIAILIYTTSRLIISISQVYLPFYLLVSLKLPKLTLSLIPLTIYIASMFSAITQKLFHKYVNRELACLFGMFFVSMFCSLVHYPGNPPSQVRVYAGAILLGVGWAFLLITSLAIVGDLVEGNTSTGAFVYGVTSFTDKMASGIIIQIIQALKPPTDKQLEKLYYKYTESYFIEGLLGFAALLLVIRFALRKIKSLPSREASLINDETCDT